MTIQDGPICCVKDIRNPRKSCFNCCSISHYGSECKAGPGPHNSYAASQLITSYQDKNADSKKTHIKKTKRSYEHRGFSSERPHKKAKQDVQLTPYARHMKSKLSRDLGSELPSISNIKPVEPEQPTKTKKKKKKEKKPKSTYTVSDPNFPMYMAKDDSSHNVSSSSTLPATLGAGKNSKQKLSKSKKAMNARQQPECGSEPNTNKKMHGSFKPKRDRQRDQSNKFERLYEDFPRGASSPQVSHDQPALTMQFNNSGNRQQQLRQVFHSPPEHQHSNSRGRARGRGGMHRNKYRNQGQDMNQFPNQGRQEVSPREDSRVSHRGHVQGRGWRGKRARGSPRGHHNK